MGKRRGDGGIESQPEVGKQEGWSSEYREVWVAIYDKNQQAGSEQDDGFRRSAAQETIQGGEQLHSDGSEDPAPLRSGAKPGGR